MARFVPIEGLDETDNRILEILSENARCGLSEIGEKVGISRVAVKKRIDNLEKQGIIAGYRVIVNRHADENLISFFMDIETEPGEYFKIMDYLAMFKFCRQIYSCTSSSRIHVTGYAPNHRQLDGFVTMLYENLKGVNKIVFQVITATHKDSDGGVEYVRHSENEYLEEQPEN